MQDLGGPTFVVSDPNGFHREDIMGMLDMPWDLGHALYGYIAIDNFFGSTIDPSLQGSTVD
jgi:hypothetical protein